MMCSLKGDAFLGALEYFSGFIASIKKELAEWTDVIFMERAFAEDASQLNVCKAGDLEEFVGQLGSSAVMLQFSLQAQHDLRVQENGTVTVSSQKKYCHKFNSQGEQHV